MMSDWKVDLVNDNISELYVEFKGPPDSELSMLQTAAVVLSPAVLMQMCIEPQARILEATGGYT